MSAIQGSELIVPIEEPYGQMLPYNHCSIGQPLADPYLPQQLHLEICWYGDLFLCLIQKQVYRVTESDQQLFFSNFQ